MPYSNEKSTPVLLIKFLISHFTTSLVLQCILSIHCKFTIHHLKPFFLSLSHSRICFYFLLLFPCNFPLTASLPSPPPRERETRQIGYRHGVSLSIAATLSCLCHQAFTSLSRALDFCMPLRVAKAAYDC